MGNAGSSVLGSIQDSLSTGLSIYMDVSSTDVSSGSRITGTVYVAVRKDKVDVDDIRIRFYGSLQTNIEYNQEMVRETHTNSRGGDNSADSKEVRAEVVKKKAHSHTPLIDIDYRVAMFPSGFLERGNYEYPFTITVPFGLPVSCSSSNNVLGGRFNKTSSTTRTSPTSTSTYDNIYDSNDRRGKIDYNGCNSNFAISYELDARADRHNWNSLNVMHSTPITISTPHNQHLPRQLTYIEPSESAMGCFFFWTLGTMVLGAVVSTNLVCAGDPIDVSFIVKNNSESIVYGLEISLNEVVQFRAGAHATVLKRALYSHRLRPEELGPSVAPTKKALQRPFDHSQLVDELNRVVNSGISESSGGNERRRFTLNVPIDSIADNSSNMLSVSHSLTIRAVTSIFVSGPSLTIPVTVYGRRATRPPDAAAEEGRVSVASALEGRLEWSQPQTAPVAAFGAAPALAQYSNDDPPMAQAILIASDSSSGTGHNVDRHNSGGVASRSSKGSKGKLCMESGAEAGNSARIESAEEFISHLQIYADKASAVREFLESKPNSAKDLLDRFSDICSKCDGGAFIDDIAAVLLSRMKYGVPFQQLFDLSAGAGTGGSARVRFLCNLSGYVVDKQSVRNVCASGGLSDYFVEVVAKAYEK